MQYIATIAKMKIFENMDITTNLLRVLKTKQKSSPFLEHMGR